MSDIFSSKCVRIDYQTKEGEGGDINDAIEIIIINLTEMNKLWIRMSSSKQEKTKREKERIDFKVLIGECLARLSSLDGVNIDVY